MGEVLVEVLDPIFGTHAPNAGWPDLCVCCETWEDEGRRDTRPR
jgi:hypothetical protein